MSLDTLSAPALHAALQSGDVRAASAAADELARRADAQVLRYRAALQSVRVYAVRSASGAVIGECLRHGRSEYTARPAEHTGASVPFDTHAAAVEWLRTLDYLQH